MRLLDGAGEGAMTVHDGDHLGERSVAGVDLPSEAVVMISRSAGLASAR